MSHIKELVLNTNEPVKYTNKLIKKTTDIKLQRILAVNKKNLILANITMNDTRGQERKGGVQMWTVWENGPPGLASCSR